MAKRLVLIRHAKSSWANPLQSDFDRPLNERGQRDAPEMGERLKKAGIVADKIISSTAKRAKQTVKHIAAGLDYPNDRIEWHEELYHCVPSVFEEVIYAVEDSVNTLVIVAHNPGISEFAAGLDPSMTVTDMPTCAIVVFDIETQRWSGLPTAVKRLFLYDTPKKNHE